MLATDLRRALDPATFARECLGFETLDPWQEGCLRWSGRRLLLNCARQTGKSTMASVLALHTAIYRPGSLVLLVSPSLRQSGELFRKVTDLADRLEERPALVEESRLSFKMKHGSRVVSLPSSEGTIRGFSGATLIVEDEAARVPDDLYFSVRPMLAVSGGRLILMSTPFGKRGHFHNEWTCGQNWERLQVKAAECPRITAEFLAEERASMGEWWYTQEYECAFVETEDTVFSFDLIVEALSGEVRPLFGG